MSKEIEILEANYKDVMSTPAGKAVFWDILSQCDIYNNVFGGGNDNTNYILGRRSIGKGLLEQLEQADPNFYPRLILAQQEIDKND